MGTRPESNLGPVSQALERLANDAAPRDDDLALVLEAVYSTVQRVARRSPWRATSLFNDVYARRFHKQRKLPGKSDHLAGLAARFTLDEMERRRRRGRAAKRPPADKRFELDESRDAIDERTSIQQAIDDEERARLHSAMRQLDSVDRRLLDALLRTGTLKDAADVLDISRAAASRRFGRIVDRIRDAIEGSDAEDSKDF